MLFLPLFTFSVLASYGGDYLANNIKKINIPKILRSLLPVWLIFTAILSAALISFVLFKNAQLAGVDITLGMRNINVSLRNLAFPLLLLISSTTLILFFVLTGFREFLRDLFVAFLRSKPCPVSWEKSAFADVFLPCYLHCNPLKPY